MEVSTGIDVLERIKIAANSDTDLDLATKLGLSKQAIADAKSKKKVPSAWIPKAAVLFAVSTDWLFFGDGPRHFGEQRQMPETTLEPLKTFESPINQCPKCEKFESKLETVEQERRNLSTEIQYMRMELREVNAENRRLAHENGDLRERCAKLEERQAHRSCARAIEVSHQRRPTELG